MSCGAATSIRCSHAPAGPKRKKFPGAAVENGGRCSVGMVSRPVEQAPTVGGATGRATEADVDVTSKRQTGSPGLVLALTSVAFFMVSLDALVVVTALPAIHQSIGGAIGTLEWAVTATG